MGKMSDGDRPAMETLGTPNGVEVPVPLDVLLPRSLEAPGLARQAVRRWIAALACADELVEDAALLVSEAVTNAVVHACSAPRLFVTVIEGRLRLEVHDTSHTLPMMRAPSAAIGGHGLRILDRVADAWGWSVTNTGKVVWTEQRLAARPPQQDQAFAKKLRRRGDCVHSNR
jgi:anti-sigma regulatory factor (Ser/Thr protein kinase)